MNLEERIGIEWQNSQTHQAAVTISLLVDIAQQLQDGRIPSDVSNLCRIMLKQLCEHQQLINEGIQRENKRIS